MHVAVVDHGMGNLRSVTKAFEAAGATVVVGSERSDLMQADALCVPGQGIFGRCMTNLAAEGLDSLIVEWIASERPYLGICLGMQVLFDSSEESGGAPGLGILPGHVKRFTADVRIPHIGWNTVGGDHYYFDHSFYVDPSDEDIVTAWTEHGQRFASWISTGTVTGVQFHPEKSSRAGIDLLRGWLRSDG